MEKTFSNWANECVPIQNSFQWVKTAASFVSFTYYTSILIPLSLYNAQNEGEQQEERFKCVYRQAGTCLLVFLFCHPRHILHYCYDSKLQNGITVLIFNATNDMNVIGVKDCRFGCGFNIRILLAWFSLFLSRFSLLILLYEMNNCNNVNSEMEYFQKSFQIAQRMNGMKREGKKWNKLNWNVRSIKWSAFSFCCWCQN